MAIKHQIPHESIGRFWSKVLVGPFNECWLWTAAKNGKGYGVFGIKKETDKAHRIAWRLLKGPIKEGLFLCHKCDNPSCVNPRHLFLGTNKDNVDDMFAKGRNKKPPSMGGWNKKTMPDEYVRLLGTMPDTELGKISGLSKYVIQRIRTDLFIKAFPCPTRFKSGDPHPCWSRKKKGG